LDTLHNFFDWCVGHWAFCAFMLGMIFEIPKFKLRPFTRILRFIGRQLNSDVTVRIDRLTNDVDGLKTELDQVKIENEKQMEVIDMNDVNFIRTTILDFANSLRQGREHTEEEYDHIVDLNDQYQKYIEKYNIRNGRFDLAYQYILKCGDECVHGNGTHHFLA